MISTAMPLSISVVTPCLNDAVHLSEMIESFLAQDYPHKELFIQDGGSTDGTLDILRRYPVRWVSEPDTGPHDAINKAIAAACGDVVVIIPANDLFAPGAFSRAVAELQARPDIAMVYGDCAIAAADGSPIRIESPGEFKLDNLFWHHWLLLQSAYMRREMFDRVGLFDGTILGPGDTDWVLRMAALYTADQLRYVPEVLSLYRFGQSWGGVQFRNCEQSAKVLLRAHKRLLAASETASRLRYSVRRARAGSNLQAGFWLAQAGQRQRALWYLLRAVVQWPWLALTRKGASLSVKILLGRELMPPCVRAVIGMRTALRDCLAGRAILPAQRQATSRPSSHARGGHADCKRVDRH